jgi:checkpoint serine/threonine-protein kinase
LRTYLGQDPLEPWYTYIVWVEQTFSKTGRDGNLNILLEKCIKEFKGEDKYNQDPRFLDVWMKYVRKKKPPIES